jgi:hypothetical protein
LNFKANCIKRGLLLVEMLRLKSPALLVIGLWLDRCCRQKVELH